ncbi:MAG: GGDEF domain-containing protein, partial [Pseudomonadota bacterium]
QQIHRAERYGHPLSLVLLDIDAFKAINDNHGLRVGDGVLCSLARLLARNLRESDQLCRWGGEAFLVLIPHSDPHQALQLAQRLRSLLARNPLLVDRPITASFGVASLQPGEALSELLRLARRALLRAKATGRNRIECASTELDRPGDDPGKTWPLASLSPSHNGTSRLK